MVMLSASQLVATTQPHAAYLEVVALHLAAKARLDEQGDAVIEGRLARRDRPRCLDG